MEIKDIIQEEIETFFISEEQVDDEIIDFDNINLLQEFNVLNRELFGGDVPNVPLKWSRRKSALGHVRMKVNRTTRELLSMELWMSTFFAVTYQQFLNTMAHEMIHVLLNTQSVERTGIEELYYDPHGREFMKEADRINSMGLGFNITKSNGEDLAVSDKTKANIKPLIAMIYDFDGQYNVGVTTPNVYQRDFDRLVEILQHAINRGKYNRIELNVIETQNPQLLKYTQQRSFQRSVGHASISDELLGELLDDNIIKTVTLERDREPMVAEEVIYVQ